MRIVIESASSFDSLQSQINVPNATYVLECNQQTFGTIANPLVFPAGSNIEFCGGSFIGGYVLINGLLQNDVIYPVWNNVNILYSSSNYVRSGFLNEYLRPEWFGAIGDGVTDDSIALQQCIVEARLSGAKIFLAAKRYLLKSPIHLFSGSYIEGALPGSIDRNVQIGSSLVFDLSDETDAAIVLDSSVKDSAGQNIDPSGCYKFMIKRLGIINNKTTTNIGLRLTSSNEDPVPREGLIENVLIYHFETGILVNSLSYVKFSQICLIGYKTGIQINKTGLYVEFGWFYDIYMNTTLPNSVGLDINSGNNLYFNEVDINDCTQGMWLHSDQPLFNYFFSRINLMRCGTGVAIKAVDNFITRLNFSEVTLYYSECGFSFDREGYYNIGDSSFVDIIDSVENNLKLLWIKDSSLSLASCIFERVRALGRIVGFSHVGRLNLFNIVSSGEFVMSAGTQSYTYVITNRSVLDFAPSVFVDCSDKNLVYSVTVSNTLLGNLSIRIDVDSSLTQNVQFNYFFPRLS